MDIVAWLESISGWIWGLPMIIPLIGTGLWLTIVLKGVQFRALPHALSLAFLRKSDTDEEGDVSHFQALMTALSATVGTGNIVGVALAIGVGGPGALFWMWVTGLVGMATKYAEAVLAVKYRQTDRFGNMSGGPMYYIALGLKQRWLGVAFAFFAALAAFGIGNLVQCNSVSGSMLDAFAVPKWVTGIVLAAATAAVVIGGIKSIGRVTGILVPAMICIYVGLALFILVLHVADIPDALALIFREAFSGKAGAGGFLGAAMMMALREGVRRGLFSNESGLGSSPIAAAAARTSCPSTQALVSMTQTFIDTICVCTLTGLVIIVTGAIDSGEVGVNMTQAGFADGLGSDFGRMAVAVCLALFAFSTVIGWSYYGERSLVFLVGEWALKPYRLVWVIAAFFGASIDKVESVWHLADIFNGLMAFPNLVALLLLTPVIMAETRKYFHGLKCNDV